MGSSWAILPPFCIFPKGLIMKCQGLSSIKYLFQFYTPLQQQVIMKMNKRDYHFFLSLLFFSHFTGHSSIQTQQLKLSIYLYLSLWGDPPHPPSCYRIAAKIKVRCPQNLRGEYLSSLLSHLFLFSHILHFLNRP